MGSMVNQEEGRGEKMEWRRGSHWEVGNRELLEFCCRVNNEA